MTLTTACQAGNGVNIPPFDSARAFGYLEHQVSLGPRIPGSGTHRETGDWIRERLLDRTSYVSVQPFSGLYDGFEADMFNIVASFYPDKEERILLCAHWDSRPRADRDPDSARRSDPVPGANDGASGVAVLLEIAEALKNSPPPLGIDVAFFDGEDGGAYGDNSTWLLGSRHFAKVMPAGYRPKFAILLDMIGDRDLSLSRDVNSMLSAPALWGRIEELSSRLAIPIESNQMNVVDDHIPLIERGIPSVDLIDFDYPSWHTVSDTPDKCSPESLDKIGRLVLSIIYGEL